MHPKFLCLKSASFSKLIFSKCCFLNKFLYPKFCSSQVTVGTTSFAPFPRSCTLNFARFPSFGIISPFPSSFTPDLFPTSCTSIFAPLPVSSTSSFASFPSFCTLNLTHIPTSSFAPFPSPSTLPSEVPVP